MRVTADRVAVIIPSRDRPSGLRRAIDSIQSTAPGVEIVLVLDGPVAVEPGVIRVSVPDHRKQTTAALWNIGALHTERDFFVTGADDVVFLPGWLEAAIDGMQAIGGTGVVAFNEGDETFGSCATHFMMSRQYAARRLGGVIFPPVYAHGYTDVEVTLRAARDNRLFFAKEARIDHRHPFWGKAQMDEVYEKGAASEQADRALFDRRKAADFPVTWQGAIGPSETCYVEGWGRVAIAVRSYKFPEPMFMDSWTNFLLGGLRTGDRVLEIKHGQPNHVAANELARDFLIETDCDSILFIDDDMTFAPGALSVLRDNGDSWQYDAVMGFCTFKTPPPHAVVYHLADEQPGMPQALGGEVYNAQAHVPDNGLVEVDAVGIAFTLIKRHVFEALLSEHGPRWTVWFDWGKHSEGEDMRFSRRCREAGFGMAVDSSVKIGHVGRYVFGWNEHQQFVKQLEEVNSYG